MEVDKIVRLKEFSAAKRHDKHDGKCSRRCCVRGFAIQSLLPHENLPIAGLDEKDCRVEDLNFAAGPSMLRDGCKFEIIMPSSRWSGVSYIYAPLTNASNNADREEIQILSKFL